MTFNPGDRVRFTDNAGLTSRGWTGLTGTVVEKPSWVRPDGTYIRLDKGLRRGDGITESDTFVWNTSSLALIDEPAPRSDSTFEITKPVAGRVTLDLDMNDAEILMRAVGLVNAGNLSTVSPVLYEWVEEMVKVFGRNLNTEAKNYMAHSFSGQTYIEEV
jgi:hypothetical protein